MEVAFYNPTYRNAKNLPLTMRLEPLFNRPDVQQQLEAVAMHICPVGKPPAKGYSMIASTGLRMFAAKTTEGMFDGDPHNLCGAVLWALKNSNEESTRLRKEDSTMPRSVRMGLESVTRQLLMIAQSDATDSPLKEEILQVAEATGINLAQLG